MKARNSRQFTLTHQAACRGVAEHETHRRVVGTLSAMQLKKAFKTAVACFTVMVRQVTPDRQSQISQIAQPAAGMSCLGRNDPHLMDIDLKQAPDSENHVPQTELDFPVAAWTSHRQGC